MSLLYIKPTSVMDTVCHLQPQKDRETPPCISGRWRMRFSLPACQMAPSCSRDSSCRQLVRVPWVSALSVSLTSVLRVGGTERWPLARCRAESNGVMMWRLGATLPIPGMKRCCTESPRWSGGLFKKGRGPFAQTDTTLIFGQRRTRLNNKY